MSNMLIRSQTTRATVRARIGIAVCLAVLVLLAAQLPVTTLINRFGGEGVGLQTTTALGKLDAVLLLTAGVVLWALVFWVSVVFVVGLLARMLGGSSAMTLSLIRYVTPAAVRGVLITALGVGSVAALSACAPTAASSPASTMMAVEEAANTDLSLNAPTTSAQPSPVKVLASSGSSTSESSMELPATTIDLDWPSAPAPVPTAAPSTAAPSTAPPLTSSSAEAPQPPAPPPATASAPTPTSEPAPTATSAATPTSESAAPESAASGSGASTPAPSSPDVAVPDAGSETPEPDGGPNSPEPDPTAEPTGTADDAPAAVGTPPETSAQPDLDGPVTVQPGDSLWAIAAAHLRPYAAEAEIAAAWPEWYAANESLIGSDPNLIRPGWQLSIPTESGAPQA